MDSLIDKIKTAVPSILKRTAYLIIFSALLLLPLFSLASGTMLYFRDGDTVKGGFGHNPKDILLSARRCHVVLEQWDYAVSLADGGGCAAFYVNRAYDITLSYHGKAETVKTNNNISVYQLLEARGITLEDCDVLSHDPYAYVERGGTLSVDKVEYVTREAREVIPFEFIRRPTSLMKEGAERHAETGKNGLADRVYSDKYVNGVLVSSEIVEEKIITHVEHDITLVGTPGAVASSITVDSPLIPEGLTIENNVPSQYLTVLERANCTAYTSSLKNAYGAAGIGLVPGCVAVNPAVIPYGSLLYITSADGRYVYGFAIAADTGTAMLGGYTDIDCYFDTYRESAFFGRKYLNVYVIAQLNQTQLADYCSVTKSGSALFRARVPK